MSITSINLGQTVSLAEAVNITALVPQLKTHWESEPGIGKSSQLPVIARKAGIDQYFYIDATQYSTGDGATPAVNHDTKTSSFYINERYAFHTGQPVVIMIDELPKASQSVQNELHTLLEEKPRFYGVPLPEGSIVCSSGNLGSDGIGDRTKDHTINRRTTLRVRKPTNTEWIQDFAVNAGVAPSVIAWADKTPQAFASYLDGGQEDNHLIFNPRRPGRAFFSPRSAVKASHIIHMRRELGENATLCALIGSIGEQAARDMDTYIKFQNEVPAWRDIISDPRGTHIPTSAGASSVLVFGMVQRVDAETIDAVMQYLSRFDSNWQSTFCLTLSKSERKQVGFRNSSFKQWCLDNQDIL